MAELKPFNGVFYNREKVGDLREVVTLPYDIISEGRQRRYYEDSEYNYVRLVLGLEEPGDDDENNKYTRAGGFLRQWLQDGILVKDAEPGFYVYEQEYGINGARKRQAGLIALVKLEPFEKGVILPHEEIYEKPLQDRHMLLKETRACLETIISIYSDPVKETNKVFKEVMKSKPRIDLLHDDNIVNRVWPVHDKKVLDRIAELMKDKRIIIADGHHRYNTALKYSREHAGDESCAYIMMLLYNMDDDLTVMPTHRALRDVPSFNPSTALQRIREYFRVKEFPFSEKNKTVKLDKMLDALDGKKDKHAFGAYVGNGKFYLLTLKGSDMIQELVDNTKSVQWNELDVTILQSLVIDYLLGVGKGEMDKIRYVKDKLKAVELVDGGEYDISFFLNPTKLSQIKAVAEVGEKMPQKSSYFYPKPLSGLVACVFDPI